MLAARMYGINDLRIEEMPKPKIGAGEILVKVRSMAAEKLQVPSVQNFRDMAEAFQLKLPEKFLFEK